MLQPDQIQILTHHLLHACSWPSRLTSLTMKLPMCKLRGATPTSQGHSISGEEWTVPSAWKMTTGAMSCCRCIRRQGRTSGRRCRTSRGDPPQRRLVSYHAGDAKPAKNFKPGTVAEICVYKVSQCGRQMRGTQDEREQRRGDTRRSPTSRLPHPARPLAGLPAASPALCAG